MKKLTRYSVKHNELTYVEYAFIENAEGSLCNSAEVAELEEAYQKLEEENKKLKRADERKACKHPHLAWENSRPVCQDCRHNLTLSDSRTAYKALEIVCSQGRGITTDEALEQAKQRMENDNS